jgi:hypothetical protein
MVEVMEQLNDMQNVGLVYNFHHAHEDLDEFPDALQAMKPYLLCLNLNGTTAAGPKIQPIGDGERDRDILSWIRQSQYRGLIGVLDHRPELDAKESLLQNLQGLESLIALEPHGQTRDRVKRRR